MKQFALHHDGIIAYFADEREAEYRATELALDGIESRIEHLADGFPDEVFYPLDRDKIIEYIGADTLNAYMDEPAWNFCGYAWLANIASGDPDCIAEARGEA